MGWGTLTGPQENTGVQTAVSDGGRVVAAQRALYPTTPRVGLDCGCEPALEELKSSGRGWGVA